jgi:hypothetical protein
MESKKRSVMGNEEMDKKTIFGKALYHRCPYDIATTFQRPSNDLPTTLLCNLYFSVKNLAVSEMFRIFAN